jgi:uncharacterized protein YbgA (DUF1722 family)/uncharacterized protein YbbK (DUF523 family)
MESEKLRLGVSSCLLGNNVRYDGQHKLDRFIAETLGKYVEFVPVCPEVECGLPVPREAMRLVGDPEAPHLMTQRTGVDLTDRMLAWARKRLLELEKENLCGFIFKSRSPSSGMERVKVYNGHGGLSGRAPGLFAKEFMARFPLLPAEDEGRLSDPVLRENFIERIFTLRRYRAALDEKPGLANLMKFHEHNKLLLMAHSPENLRAMGRLLAQARASDARRIAGEYEEMLLKTLKLTATPGKHANVLQHMLGYLKKHLDAEEKNEMLELITNLRNELVPLIVPVTLMKHHVSKHRVEYLLGQYYLYPHPLELKLRNHV